MSHLSSPIHNIKDHYTVVVVGSGYGGSITVSRLARAGQSVCVLERGKELQPGEYPDTSVEFMSESQIHMSDGSNSRLTHGSIRLSAERRNKRTRWLRFRRHIVDQRWRRAAP